MGREELRLALVMCDGKAEEVLPAARALARTDKKGWTAYPLAIFGDAEAAAEPAQRLSEGPIRRTYEAVLAWQRGEKEQALSALRDLARGTMYDTRGLAAWLLARFAAESGRDAEVVEAVEIMRTAPGDIWRGGAWPAALLSKARAQERLGQTEGARETLDHLLAIWKRADPDLPNLAEAKAMRRRLLALR
jgi:hypothetical protein